VFPAAQLLRESSVQTQEKTLGYVSVLLDSLRFSIFHALAFDPAREKPAFHGKGGAAERRERGH